MHQKDNFFQGNPTMFHVGVDSHDCRPVLLDDALDEMRKAFTARKEEERNEKKAETM